MVLQRARALHYCEPLSARARRLILGSAYALQPRRIHLMPRIIAETVKHAVCQASMGDLLTREIPGGYEGLIGISNDLSVEALLKAYSRGLFPVCHMGPMNWWCPLERAVLFFDEARIEKSTIKQIRKGTFAVTFDRDFAAVMQGCAQPRNGKTPLTWLTPGIMKAFWALHQAGYAHSVEVWDRDAKLVGGMFGIAIGNIFFGESQFSTVRDASKVASATLNCHLAHWGFALRDAKWMTGHLGSLGFRLIPRDEFLNVLNANVAQAGRVGRWDVDETLDTAKWASMLSARK